MQMLNVRCCCRPEKILGQLPVPEDKLFDGATFLIQFREAFCMTRAYSDAAPCINLNTEQVKIRAFMNSPRYLKEGAELAVYSDDRPAEFWRRVPGFVENRAPNG